MDRINIMTSCDDGIAEYMLPQIASIGVNLNNYDVHFFLVHSRISSKKISLIREYSKTFSHIQFHEIVIENTEPYEHLTTGGGRWPHEAYFSACCHEYLPMDVERILYIDTGDIIIAGDIAEYYFGDFENCSLIATAFQYVESSGELRAFDKDDMNDENLLRRIKRGVFNSGSYVINVAKLREDKLTLDDFIYVSTVLQQHFSPKSGDQAAYAGDQGLLSVAFLGDIKYFGYPEIKDMHYMPYNFGLYFYEDMSELWYTPKILHYAKAKLLKPWCARFSLEEIEKYDFKTNYPDRKAPDYIKRDYVELFNIWWEYCKLTPVYEALNRDALVYSRALETHFLPLCQKYNDLVVARFKENEKKHTMKRINIMTSCNDGIAQYILPQIASIGVNLTAYEVHFYIFHRSISSEKMNLICDYANLFTNISIHEIVIEDITAYERLLRGSGDWPCEAYFSLCCHHYLPDDIERILYIDTGDVIIDGDVSEYYFGDFEGYSFIATALRYANDGDVLRPFNKDDLTDQKLLQAIKGGLFNSGSYVINVAKLRDDNLTMDDFIYVSDVLYDNFCPEAGDSVAYTGDQGLIGVAFAGDIKYFGYPEIKNVYYMPYDFCTYFFDKIPELWYTPKIIHFVGQGLHKPWNVRFSVEEVSKYNFKTNFNGDRAPFDLKRKHIEFLEKWWMYCEMTPIYDELNIKASTCARALETYFLPLCKQFNDLVDSLPQEKAGD